MDEQILFTQRAPEKAYAYSEGPKVVHAPHGETRLQTVFVNNIQPLAETLRLDAERAVIHHWPGVLRDFWDSKNLARLLNALRTLITVE
jgi:hypothetical protein